MNAFSRRSPARRTSSHVFVAVICAVSAISCARRAPELAAAVEPSPKVATAPSPTMEPASLAASSAPPSVGPLAGTSSEAVARRMVISEVQLSLRTESPARAAERAGALAAHAGGYVLSRDASSSEDTVVRVAMVLRVPADKLETLMGELREAGSVLDESRTGRDVTEEFSDTRAELGAQRKLEERLLGILGAARSVKEMLEVENELARVRGEADKLEGRTRYLENHAALATITLSIVSPAQPVAPVAESVGSRLRNAFSESCSLCFQVTTGLLVALGAVSPLLVPAALGAFLYRRQRRACRKAMLSA